MGPGHADGGVGMDRESLLTWWNEAWDKGLWAASWKRSLEGLTGKQAAWRPSPDRHSIWQITEHMIFWREGQLRVARGGPKSSEEEVQRLNFPVYARGVTPIGPLHRGPGEVNHRIQCGGIVIHPGDLIVGDLNGVVVIPKELATNLLERLRQHKRAESEYVAAVSRGEFSNKWVDDLLRDSGCEIDDSVRPAAAEMPAAKAGDAAMRSKLRVASNDRRGPSRG